MNIALKNVQAKSMNWLKPLSIPSRQFDLKASDWCFSHHYLYENSVIFFLRCYWFLTVIENFIKNPKDIFVRINGILMITPLMVSSKNMKVSQKRCLGTSIESFTRSSLSEQITVRIHQFLSTYISPCVRFLRSSVNAHRKANQEFLL